jgi:hypothetical protein
MQRLNAAIPMGRMANPEEIARIVAFRAGDGASYITATTVFAGGGMMHQSPGCERHPATDRPGRWASPTPGWSPIRDPGRPRTSRGPFGSCARLP